MVPVELPAAVLLVDVFFDCPKIEGGIGSASGGGNKGWRTFHTGRN